MSYKGDKTMEGKEESNSAAGLERVWFGRVLTSIPKRVLDILGVLGLSWFKGFWPIGRPATLALAGGKR